MNLDYNIIYFGTNNLANVHKFYHELLGCSVFMDQGLCRIYNMPDGGKLGFCSHINPVCDGPIISFVTQDVDAIYKLFQKKHVRCHGKPKANRRFKIYHFFAEDYDGHRIEIQKFI